MRMMVLVSMPSQSQRMDVQTQLQITMTQWLKRTMVLVSMTLILWIMELGLSLGGREYFFATLPNKSNQWMTTILLNLITIYVS
tara:strand:- start:3034 stop:3285 length:252 start_codon:yes stop_codon:yes gene_type:complete